MWETVLIDGTDVRVAGVRHVAVWDGVLASASARGSDQTFPFRDGDTPTEKAFGAFDFPLPLQLLAAGATPFNDALRALRLLVKPDRTVTLTRRLSYASGNESHTALARYVSGLDPQMVKMAGGECQLVMRILEGLWYGPAVTIGAGTSTILGDTRTRRMTITLTGGTNPTLTNTTTGDVLTYTGSPTAAVVNVEAMTATDTVDVTQHLTWSPRFFPFTLREGANTLVLTGGGSVAISYQPAFQ